MSTPPLQHRQRGEQPATKISTEPRANRRSHVRGRGGGGRGCSSSSSRSQRASARRACASHRLREVRDTLGAAETTGIVNGGLLVFGIADAGQAARDAADEGIAAADTLSVEYVAVPDRAARGELGQTVFLSGLAFPLTETLKTEDLVA
jgi:hypothetical protein